MRDQRSATGAWGRLNSYVLITRRFVCRLLGIDAAAPDSSLATGSGDDRIDVATEVRTDVNGFLLGSGVPTRQDLIDNDATGHHRPPMMLPDPDTAVHPT